MPDRPSHSFKKFAWPLFWILWLVVPWLNDWFFSSRVECASCFRDVFIHCLAIFGYVVLGGFIFSLSKPTREHQTEAQRSALPHGYMLGTREDVLLTFILLGGTFGIASFFSLYIF